MDHSVLWLSFIEGMGLVLSPCILPILPVILVTGIQGGKLRPYGIITGFIITFVLFTLFARKLFSFINIDPMLLQNIAIYLILAFGIILFSDTLSDKFSAYFQRFANLGQTLSDKAEARLPKGYWSGVLIGSGIALIWTPCAGPIMAAVLVQTLQQKVDTEAELILTAFSIGVALPMLVITLFSKTILQQIKAASRHASVVRKVLASIIIVTMLFTKFDVWQKLALVEGPPIAPREFLPASQLINGVLTPYSAPEITGINHWINSPPLTLEELKKQGKVVLIDFWTYSCINCVRTLPYIKDWYKKYHDKGLVIIGVHSPEFEFEKKIENVEKAVKEYGILYPVAIDNELKTWLNFSNRYWPAHYLINSNGQVVYTHFGEGEYEVTENNIRYLLGLGTMADYKEPEEIKVPISPLQSPETYLGYIRAEGFSSPQGLARDREEVYTYPTDIPLNQWALKGKWTSGSQHITANEPNASLKYHFYAKQVYLVMAPGNAKTPQKVKVLFNGKPTKELSIDRSTLYELISFKEMTMGIIEIEALDAGLEAFAFTFGAE